MGAQRLLLPLLFCMEFPSPCKYYPKDFLRQFFQYTVYYEAVSYAWVDTLFSETSFQERKCNSTCVPGSLQNNDRYRLVTREEGSICPVLVDFLTKRSVIYSLCLGQLCAATVYTPLTPPPPHCHVRHLFCIPKIETWYSIVTAC